MESVEIGGGRRKEGGRRREEEGGKEEGSGRKEEGGVRKEEGKGRKEEGGEKKEEGGGRRRVEGKRREEGGEREEGGGKEWQSLRLEVLRNLARIYRKLNDWRKGYWVLKDLAGEVKAELFVEDPDKCLKGVDSFYLDLAIFSFKQGDYSSSSLFLNDAIVFLRSLLRNSKILTFLESKFRKENDPKRFENLIFKKNRRIAYMLYLNALNYERLDLIEESLFQIEQVRRRLEGGLG